MLGMISATQSSRHEILAHTASRKYTWKRRPSVCLFSKWREMIVWRIARWKMSQEHRETLYRARNITRILLRRHTSMLICHFNASNSNDIFCDNNNNINNNNDDEDDDVISENNNDIMYRKMHFIYSCIDSDDTVNSIK